MFARTIPRAAPRISAFAQCEAQPAIHRLAQLSSRTRAGTWSPVKQPLGRRYRSSMRGFVGEQMRKSPILFPFAVVM
jgi:hypothetical protein